jgi:hypothetical protein
MLIYIPYSLGKSRELLKPYPVLETFKGSAYAPYMQTLNWLLMVESINYNSVYSLMMSTGLFESVEDNYKAKELMHTVTRELTGLNKSSKDKYLEQ